MIQDLDAPMNVKDPTAWLKLNPFIEVSLEAQATEEGTGRNVGKLGALICEGVDDGKHIAKLMLVVDCQMHREMSFGQTKIN